jgi:hypothetical protein
MLYLVISWLIRMHNLRLLLVAQLPNPEPHHARGIDQRLRHGSHALSTPVPDGIIITHMI